MIDPNLLSKLRCPVTGHPLKLAAPPLVERVNEAIKRGLARDRHDQRVEQPIEAGLVTEDQGWVYPIRDGIPVMIGDQAIAIERRS